MVLPEVLRVRLAPHPTARDAAVAVVPAKAGDPIAIVPALSTVISPDQKSWRCDQCGTASMGFLNLRRCSGCASFWYCGTICQNKAWKAHHRKICKNHDAFVASPEYQALTAHDKMDALLLSQMLADPAPWWNASGSAEYSLSDPYTTFLHLLKGPRVDGFVPPLCLPPGAATAETAALAKELYSRFGNNNFVVQDHLNSVGHGVFPLASRFFNHSCVPNAACKYPTQPEKPLTMEVVALRDIAAGEEVTVPYLDPALPYQTRQDALRANYGFQCGCRLCLFQRGIEPVASPPQRGSEELRDMETALRAFALGGDEHAVRLPAHPALFETLPANLHPIFHESYLPSLSELFSKLSHEGPFVDAIEAGITQLALYAVVYPPNYPQIGMHALELGKTVWNLVCTAGPEAAAADIKVREEQAEMFLDLADEVLNVYGEEGDICGPLGEIRVLRDMMSGRCDAVDD
ncbi:SET domain-containing protein [Trametes coccinea BRFM310]|uniref:SET domain-containing protein n=1 Tax=Trametes coccinea (strain BRFM310) TaxID=1353009 RepID=A0A1Y2J1I1_TRAC3|nr:SET domain-containing protein [Trametes coccinea BRFM310]